MELLQLSNVTKKFGGVVACHDVSFSVKQGSIVGLIGPNGAGKTTMFNLISGVYAPTTGEISYDGIRIQGQRPDRIVAMGIARTFQNIRLFKSLSVLETVSVAVDRQAAYGLPAALFRLPGVLAAEKQVREQACGYLEAVGLQNRLDARADSLPYGLQRKLEIARAVALKPKLLLLDEPAAGMNPEESRDLAALIREIHQRYQLTILLIEHHMDVVMELCDRIVVLNFGEKLSEGTCREIQEDSAVLCAYLGEGYKHARN